MVLATGAVTWTIGSWVQARLADPWGAARLVRLGGIVSFSSVAVYALGLSSATPVWIWFAGSALAGFGIGVAYAPLSVVTLADAEPGREGVAATALQLSEVFGIAVGTGFAGALVAFGERFTDTNAPALLAVFALASGFFVVLAVGSARLVATRPTALRTPSREPGR
jgi:MFS family permease